MIIFDCDGVLVDSEPLAAEAYVRVYAKHGLTITPEVISEGIGMKQADIIALIAKLTGCRLPQEATAELWPELHSLFVKHLAPTPGCSQFLAGWKGARCVASSSSLERIRVSLECVALTAFFGNDIFSTSMVKRGKPAPDIFLFAAQKMGILPQACIVVEDSPFGIAGAVAAGALAVGYTGGSHSSVDHAGRLLAAGAHAVVSSWAGLERVLRNLGV